MGVPGPVDTAYLADMQAMVDNVAQYHQCINRLTQESIKTNTFNTCHKIGQFGFGRDPKKFVVNFQLPMIYNL